MAVDLNGSNQYLNASGLTVGGADFSVAATIICDTRSVGRGVMGSSGSTAWFIQIGGDPTNGLAFGTAGDPSTFPTGTLRRVVGTYTHSGTTCRLYIDGTLVASNSSSALASSTGIDIGRRGDGFAYWDGMIAEVAVWPGLALSAANAREYARGYTPDQIRPDKLRGYWEQTKNDGYRDMAGGRTLTAFNSPGWRTHPRMIGRTMAQVGQSAAPEPEDVFEQPIIGRHGVGFGFGSD